jgi:hypothetical protein
MIQNVQNMLYSQAVVMLKQAEERTQAIVRGPYVETVHYAWDRALVAYEMPKMNALRRGRSGFSGRYAGDNRPYIKPTRGSREC